MTGMRMKPLSIGIIILLFIAIGVIEIVLKPSGYGSLLFTLVFWTGLIQGCIALVAAVDLSNGKWIKPIKSHLLSVYPLLLFLAFVFLFLFPQLDMYSWSKHEGIWLNKQFFMLRNFIILLMTYFIARKFAIESMKNSANKNRVGVLYLLFFVISQSFIAFDWVMSIEYPWFSTLFGVYFFVESVYAGIALAGIICFFITKPKDSGTIIPVKQTLRDAATMMFGFSLFWAGLFFGQFLVIWYGNVPEEISYLVTRLTHSPLRELSIISFLLLFPVPFITMLFKSTKSSPVIVLIISLLVLLGIFIERLVFLIPGTSIDVFFTIFEFVGLAYLFILAQTNTRSMFQPS